MIPSSPAAPLIVREQRPKKLQRTRCQNIFRFLTASKKAIHRRSKIQSIRNHQKALRRLKDKQMMHPHRGRYYTITTQELRDIIFK